MTDVVLVSMGRYPVLKNPFKLVKPLTHKTLGSECECVCAYHNSVTICLLIACVGLCSLTVIARASGGRLLNKKQQVACAANLPVFVGGETGGGDEERRIQKGDRRRLKEGRRQ